GIDRCRGNLRYQQALGHHASNRRRPARESTRVISRPLPRRAVSILRRARWLELSRRTHSSRGWKGARMTNDLLIRDVLDRDPSQASLQNDGVSKVENTATLH